MKTFTDSTLMPFGKHKGKLLGQVPSLYLHWLAGQDWMYGQRELSNYIEARLDREAAAVVKKETGQAPELKPARVKMAPLPKDYLRKFTETL